MQLFSFIFLLMLSLAVVGQASANDVGSHCVQFGDDHPGCDIIDDNGGGEHSAHHSSYQAQRRDPVSSSEFVFATACSRGASGQGIGLGGAIAFTNEICDLALAEEMAERAGDLETRDKLVKRAAELAFARGNKLRVWLQWIPVIGQFM